MNVSRREFIGGAAAIAAAPAFAKKPEDIRAVFLPWGHNMWGEMVTTTPYYNACRDLIRDAAEMFDHPRFLHIGYDEERISHQKGFLMAPWAGDYDEKDFLKKNFAGIDQLAAAMV